jgi:hypothetical protein
MGCEDFSWRSYAVHTKTSEMTKTLLSTTRNKKMQQVVLNPRGFIPRGLPRGSSFGEEFCIFAAAEDSGMDNRGGATEGSKCEANHPQASVASLNARTIPYFRIR